MTTEMDFLNELFEYNLNSNGALISSFEKIQGAAPDKSVQLLNHIVNAHQIWISRIRNQKSTGVWDTRPLGDVRDLDMINHKETMAILSGTDLSAEISYTTTKGVTFQNTVRDILFHIINHSTYHRGQIAMDFRNYDTDPVQTDYIIYKRSVSG